MYLDTYDLHHRGWTEALIKRFLGEPDTWESVSHYLNFRGKKAYYLERVHAVENAQDFQEAFAVSLGRRKATDEQRAEFMRHRKLTERELSRITLP